MIKHINETKPAIEVQATITGDYIVSYLWDSTDRRAYRSVIKEAFAQVKKQCKKDYPAYPPATMGSGVTVKVSASDILPEHKRMAI